MKIEGKIEAAARATDGERERERECVCVCVCVCKSSSGKEDEEGAWELVCRQALKRSTAFASGVKGRGREFRDLWPGVQQPWPGV
jgi:hypothetical protein